MPPPNAEPRTTQLFRKGLEPGRGPAEGRSGVREGLRLGPWGSGDHAVSLAGDIFRLDLSALSGNLADRLDGGPGADRIEDFGPGADRILLDRTVFPGIGAALTANEFFRGAAAHDADDRIVYNPATGVFLFDRNGDRAGGAALIATLDRALGLDHHDFLMV